MPGRIIQRENAMGWFYPHETTTRESLVIYLRRPERFGDKLELVRATVKGNRHWYLMRIRETGMHVIGLDLMQGTRGESSWGYKDMDESVGPYYWDCPITYLDAPADESVGSTSEWRAQVRRYHAEQKQKAKPEAGGIVRFGDGREFMLRYPISRKGWCATDSRGVQWRLTCAQLRRNEYRAPASVEVAA
jgi:hypothetical protein